MKNINDYPDYENEVGDVIPCFTKIPNGKLPNGYIHTPREIQDMVCIMKIQGFTSEDIFEALEENFKYKTDNFMMLYYIFNKNGISEKLVRDRYDNTSIKPIENIDEEWDSFK